MLDPLAPADGQVPVHDLGRVPTKLDETSLVPNAGLAWAAALVQGCPGSDRASPLGCERLHDRDCSLNGGERRNGEGDVALG